MDVLNDIYLERENFEDRELLEKIKCLDCLLKCLLQTIEDQTHSNRLFFTGLVKKLSQNCLVNATPNLLDLQRSQFRSSALASLNEFRALKNLEEASTLFNLRRNETTFISLFKCINAIVRLFEHVDVTDLDTSTIESYFDCELDVEEFFGQFPEFNKYTDFNIHLGPIFVYRFNGSVNT